MSLAMKVARSRVTGVRPASYRGDPGLFGFIGKAVGAVTGIASKFLPGPLGAAAGLVSGLVTPKPRASIFPGRFGTRPTTVATQMPVLRSLPAIGPRPVAPPMAVNGAVPPGYQEATRQQPGIRDGTQLFRDDALVTACPSGERPNKAPYFEYVDAIDAVVFHPTGTKCVKIRRRNPFNPRAIDRAVSRITSGKRAAKKLSRITIRPKCSHS